MPFPAMPFPPRGAPPPPPKPEPSAALTAPPATSTLRLESRHLANQDSAERRVVACSLPLQDATSKLPCSYTGQIDIDSQLPDGMGTLR